MVTVITYGTYDMFHYGHIKLLERAKQLGDYLIVGVTSTDYDKTRGKINVQQTLMERIENVKSTGLADKIIVEEYEGQKIDDIKRYSVDIFTVGSDWQGKFDYLKEYCDVIYLERTKGISSSDLRSKERALTMGIVGDSYNYIDKFQKEDKYVNGIEIIGICTNCLAKMSDNVKNLQYVTNDYNELLSKVESVYIKSKSQYHYEQVKQALKAGKHVLCESPICEDKEQCKELFELAKNKNLILLDSIRTAYATAYSRLLLLIKSGKIGNVVSVDATCTNMKNLEDNDNKPESMRDWGYNALLPIFQILGTDYLKSNITSFFIDEEKRYDYFSKVDFVYKNAVASIKVAEAAKSEGDLVITGTKGYIYVPAPWWKTDYFEVRYEDNENSERYFYQLDGEGIRYTLVAFARSVYEKKPIRFIEPNVSQEICKIVGDTYIINKK